jgi:DNA processing protein
MSKTPDRDLLIALHLLPFLTPNRLRLLFNCFNPIGSARNAPTRLLQETMRLTPEQATRVKHSLTTASADPAVTSLRDSVITTLDDVYPALLREIPDPPPVLHIRGNMDIPTQPMLAIVGSRRASPYAINAAEHLARTLAGLGVAIVSGLAIGVDAAAHRAALDAGGKTVAVLGNGIDILYPRSNQNLAARIATEGLILTEFPPGTPPLKPHFPIRNRIISGLSLGTVIVEAGPRSGSLITARTALEQNREVFCVPGSIFSPGSEGPHRLVQTGAKLVHDLQDILDELSLSIRVSASSPPEPPSPLREVLAAFSRDLATRVEDAALSLGQSPATVAESLLELELAGWLRALPGARYVRTR